MLPLHLNFIHINPGSLKPHISEVSSLVHSVNVDLIAVSETWFNGKINDNLVNIPGFRLIRHDRKKKRGGGVAIYVRQTLKVSLLDKSHSNSTTEFLAIQLDACDNRKLAFCVAYNPPSNTRLNPLLNQLSKLSQKFEDCIVVGDFNINLLSPAPSVNRFKNFLTLNSFSTRFNEPTNFVKGKKPSQIDLVLVKDESLLTRFSQLTFGAFSSHDILYGSYNFDVNRLQSDGFYFRDVKRINRNDLILAAYEQDWDLIHSLPLIDDKVNYVTFLLQNLLNRFAPLRHITIKTSSKPPWFSNELQRLINIRDFYLIASRKEKIAYKKQSLYAKYKHFRNKVTVLKRNLNCQHVKKRLDFGLPAAKLWSNLKKLGVTKSNINYAAEFSCNEFNSYFSSVFSTSSVNNLVFHDQDAASNTLNFCCVSDSEVVAAITSIKTNATGLDEISSSFIKLLCPFIVPFLTSIINDCITQSYFPNLWKVAVVRPIPKVPQPQHVSDFRPISILPCLSKVLERVILNQIQEFVASKNLLSEFQSGFRAGYGTDTAMLKVVHDLATAMDKGEASIIVSLDLRKAFDCVDHKKLLYKLNQKFHFSSLSCSLLESYLSDRWQCVQANDEISGLVSVTSGTPQGGILSAMLFSLFINDISEILDINYHLYADDSQIYCSASSALECATLVNKNLENILRWSEENSLSINPEKSQAMLLQKMKTCSPPTIFIGNSVINYHDEIRLLGLIVDSKLCWQSHINKICREVSAGVAMLRQTQSVIPQAIKIYLVKSLLVPKFLFMSYIYMNCSRTLWKQLNHSFRLCTRYAFSISKFDSLNGCRDKILGCELETFLKFRACIFIFNLLKKKSPSYLFHLLKFPRFQRGKMLSFPPKSSRKCGSFFVYGTHLWNSLSSEIRTLNSADAFRQECLSYLALERAR
jgi:hypothetical protein